jgi:hypothetical protein
MDARLPRSGTGHGGRRDCRRQVGHDGKIGVVVVVVVFCGPEGFLQSRAFLLLHSIILGIFILRWSCLYFSCACQYVSRGLWAVSTAGPPTCIDGISHGILSAYIIVLPYHTLSMDSMDSWPVAPGPETSVRRGLGAPGHHLLYGGNINLILPCRVFARVPRVRSSLLSSGLCSPFISSQYYFFSLCARRSLSPLLPWWAAGEGTRGGLVVVCVVHCIGPWLAGICRGAQSCSQDAYRPPSATANCWLM